MEKYALVEHFKLVKNGTIEGMKCNYYQGNNGNILIYYTQAKKALKIKNEVGFLELFEDKHCDDIFPYFIEIGIRDDKHTLNPDFYLTPRLLKKALKITKQDPEIISELDL